MGTYLRLSDKEDGYVNDLLRKARSNSLVSHNQDIFEANYNYRIIEGTYLAGSRQYLVNPDPTRSAGRPLSLRRRTFW